MTFRITKRRMLIFNSAMFLCQLWFWANWSHLAMQKLVAQSPVFYSGWFIIMASLLAVIALIWSLQNRTTTQGMRERSWFGIIGTTSEFVFAYSTAVIAAVPVIAMCKILAARP